MRGLTRTAAAWMPLGIAITGICIVVYAAVQQNYRQSLNDPQIQIAEDGAATLAGGGVPAQLVERGVSVDIGASLSPWIAVYDQQGTPLESSAVLNNAPPKPPLGLFDTSTWSSSKRFDFNGMRETRVTWQPPCGSDHYGSACVRQAIVIVQVGEKFVVAGRNMREVENREYALSFMLGCAWIVLLIATFIATLVSRALLAR